MVSAVSYTHHSSPVRVQPARGCKKLAVTPNDKVSGNSPSRKRRISQGSLGSDTKKVKTVAAQVLELTDAEQEALNKEFLSAFNKFMDPYYPFSLRESLRKEIKDLVDKGADPNQAPRSCGRSAIYILCTMDKPPISLLVKVLEKCRNINEHRLKVSLLHLCLKIVTSEKPAMKCLEMGADPNFKDEFGEKPLEVFRDQIEVYRAYEFDIAALYRALKEREATASHGRITILHWACSFRLEDLVAACLEHGQDLLKPDADGCSSLSYSFKHVKTHPEFVVSLLERVHPWQDLEKWRPHVQCRNLAVIAEALTQDILSKDDKEELLLYLPRKQFKELCHLCLKEHPRFSPLLKTLLLRINGWPPKKVIREYVTVRIRTMRYSPKLENVLLTLFDKIPVTFYGMDVILTTLLCLPTRSVRSMNRQAETQNPWFVIMDAVEPGKRAQLMDFVQHLSKREIEALVNELLPNCRVPIHGIEKRVLVALLKGILERKIEAKDIEKFSLYSMIYPGIDDPALCQEEWQLHQELLGDVLELFTSTVSDQHLTDIVGDSIWVLAFLFHHPQLAKTLVKRCLGLGSIDIADNGHAPNAWEEFCQEALLAISTVPMSPQSESMKKLKSAFEQLQGQEPEVGRSTSWLKTFEQEPWTRVKRLGRTDLYQNREDGTFLAVKWQKVGESADGLLKECAAVRFFQKYKKALGLKSEFPNPQGVVEFYGPLEKDYFKGMEVDIVAKNPLSRRLAYVYTFPNSSYFTYLHSKDLSEDDFQRGRLAAINDLFRLARNKLLMTSLADIFHNSDRGRQDAGRYLPFPGMIMGGWRKGRGSGRLERGVFSTIEYLDERASGLADGGDCEFLDVLNDPSYPLMQQSFRILFTRKGYDKDITALFLMANFLGEYHLVDELLLGRRSFERQELNWQNNRSVSELAESLIKGVTQATSSFLNLSHRVVRRFVESSGINWQRYARQIAFWVMNNDQGYLPHVKRGEIPQNIYGKHTQVTVADTSEMRGWSDSKGFFYTNEPDLGTVNGPYVIKEGERSRNIMVAFMLGVGKMMDLAKSFSAEGDQLVQKRDFAQARKKFETSLFLNPYSAKTFASLAKVHRALNNDTLADICWKHYAALKMQQTFDRKKEKVVNPHV